MDFEFIGFIAGIIILCAHFPQIIKSVKTKKTEDISLTLYCMIGTGMFLWLLYGYLTGALAVMVMNTIAICAVSTMIILKLKYGMHRETISEARAKRVCCNQLNEDGLPPTHSHEEDWGKPD